MKIRKKIGYARVSTEDQKTNYSLEAQQKELKAFGAEIIHCEVVSGNGKKPVLEQIIASLEPNDCLAVTKLDRFSRNTLQALIDVQEIQRRGASFVALDLPGSESPETSQLIFCVLVSLAEFETKRRRARQLEGVQLAKAQGKYLGRKKKLNDKLIKRIQTLYSQNLTVAEICEITKISRSTFYRYFSVDSEIKLREGGSNE